MKQSILMVCLGNICRSPLAEGILRHLIEERGLSHSIVVDSCGTSSYHVGEPPHRGSQEVARQRGVSLQGIRSRQLVTADISSFDYLVAMDESNLRDIQHLDSRGEKDERMVLLLDYAADTDVQNVPDPFYEGGFERVYDLIYRGCVGLLDHITST